MRIKLIFVKKPKMKSSLMQLRKLDILPYMHYIFSLNDSENQDQSNNIYNTSFKYYDTNQKKLRVKIKKSLLKSFQNGWLCIDPPINM